ncbi:MAG: roadblock/LC7 domain-containing protein, partial [Verrucomicrobiae bacterium]|nr:roadblock/LC7 domain-containing protein [Verrucomicrobiae bacterium]
MQPILTVAAAEKLLNTLEQFLEKSEALFAMVIDRGGIILSQTGRPPESADINVLAALAAGSFAATRELATRVGESEFNALYQQGTHFHILMNAADDDTMLVTIFGSQTTVGMVRFYAARTAELIAQLMQQARTTPAEATPIFTEQDLNNATDIFRHGAP